MAKYPGFIFYPGDYLRDTQCLSEKVQVAYDRIMCEHMRNICISQQQLDFFTKRLSDAEKQELAMVLTKMDDGFCILWVFESISKSKAYSESRSKNRLGKNKKDVKSYVKHMESENEIDIDTENKDRGVGKGDDSSGAYIPRETFEGEVIFDIEKFLLDRPAMLEQVLMVKPGMTLQKGKEILKKFHLWTKGKEQYPKHPAALTAGFQTWLLNENKYNNGADQQTASGGGRKLGTSEARTEKARTWGSEFISVRSATGAQDQPGDH